MLTQEDAAQAGSATQVGEPHYVCHLVLAPALLHSHRLRISQPTPVLPPGATSLAKCYPCARRGTGRPSRAFDQETEPAPRCPEDNEGAEAARARPGAEGDRQGRGSHANGDFDVAARSGAGALFLSHHISFTFLMQE